MNQDTTQINAIVTLLLWIVHISIYCYICLNYIKLLV